mmetsp:Transcript_8345/g.7409  ORF Transcript_8345/g.7409 Transcript_8345/m.7409 type:complete len:118 (-) Transcript_8345:253-606(-)
MLTPLAVAFDQAFLGPIAMTTNLFFLEYFKSWNYEQSKNNLTSKFWEGLSRSWSYWPFVSFVNLALIPFHYQAPFLYVCGFVWGIYLSYLQNCFTPECRSGKGSQIIDMKVHERGDT